MCWFRGYGVAARQGTNCGGRAPLPWRGSAPVPPAPSAQHRPRRLAKYLTITALTAAKPWPRRDGAAQRRRGGGARGGGSGERRGEADGLCGGGVRLCERPWRRSGSRSGRRRTASVGGAAWEGLGRLRTGRDWGRRGAARSFERASEQASGRLRFGGFYIFTIIKLTLIKYHF